MCCTRRCWCLLYWLILLTLAPCPQIRNYWRIVVVAVLSLLAAVSLLLAVSVMNFSDRNLQFFFPEQVAVQCNHQFLTSDNHLQLVMARLVNDV